MSHADPGGAATGATPELATRVVHLLTASGLTVAVAESLTGGLVCAALTDVPGASRCLRGGVVAYATDLKAALLGVDPELLTREGAVHPDVARAMALGVATALGADVGVATTGVAGPDPQDGRPPGTVHVAVSGPSGVVVESLSPGPWTGDRASVRAHACTVALALLLRVLDPAGHPVGHQGTAGS